MSQYNTVNGTTPQTSILPAGSTKLSRHFPALDPSLPNNTGAAVQFPDLDPGILQAAQVTITAAQALALNTTPITLVAAQGAGTIIQVEAVYVNVTFNSAAYTGNNNMEIRYTNGSGVKASADVPYATIQTASGVGYYYAIGASGVPVANAPIVAATPVANWAAGDSPIVVTVVYRVITP